MNIQSLHQARLIVALEGAANNPSRHQGVWLTTMELCEAAKIARRTASLWLFRLHQAGIALKEDVYPGPMWALSDTPETAALVEKAQATVARYAAREKEPGQLKKTRRFGIRSFVE